MTDFPPAIGRFEILPIYSTVSAAKEVEKYTMNGNIFRLVFTFVVFSVMKYLDLLFYYFSLRVLNATQW